MLIAESPLRKQDEGEMAMVARAQAMTEHHAPPVVTTAVKACRC